MGCAKLADGDGKPVGIGALPLCESVCLPYEPQPPIDNRVAIAGRRGLSGSAHLYREVRGQRGNHLAEGGVPLPIAHLPQSVLDGGHCAAPLQARADQQQPGGE